MATPTNEGKANTANPTTQPSDDGFFVDLDKCFDVWLSSLSKERVPSVSVLLEQEAPTASFYIESLTGSNCDMTFEGVLQVEGHLSGSIHSSNGTLVMPAEGMIEADIDVGVALINGWVNGNITASEKVVLNARARVLGNIKTPALSINDGAVFEGECISREDLELEAPEMADEEELLETLVAV